MSRGSGCAEACPEAVYPERPYVPPVLIGLVSLVVTSNLVLYGAVGASQAFAVFALASAGACLLALRKRSRLRDSLVAALLAALVGAALSGAAIGHTDSLAAELSSTPVSAWEFTARGDGSQTESGWLCVAGASAGSGVTGEVWLSSPDRLEPGERVRAIGRFSANAADDWGTSSRARGISGRVKVVRVTCRERPEGLLGDVRRAVLARIDPERSDERALLAGVVAGERSELKSRGLSDEFAGVGLSHLIAVSGAHLAIVGTVIDAALLSLGLSRRSRTLATLGACACFVLFCGCPVSAVRAWAMLASSKCGALLGRRGHVPSGLGVAGIVMCVLDPCCAADLGFQLSMLSVASLALFSGYAEAMAAQMLPAPRRWRRLRLSASVRLRLARLGRVVRSSLCASIVCQAATLPLSVVTFGRVSLVGPVASLLVGPLLAPLVCLAAAACVFGGVPVVGGALMACAAAVARLVLLIVRLLGSFPLASVAASAPVWAEALPLAAGALLLVAWPRPSRGRLRALACALSAIAIVAFLKIAVFVLPSVTVLDVGQGDAILIRDGPHALLVDTGPGDAIVEALARRHVLWLDGVVLTHLHDDHTGGVDDLAGLVPTGALYVGEGASDSLTGSLGLSASELVGDNVGELGRGDVMRMGGFTLTCLWPREASDGSQNEDSVCLLVEYERGGVALRMLLTGDAESDVMSDVAPLAGDVDVLKVGHHGSRVSITGEEATRLAAEVAVASAGAGNSYGHPTTECVETLEGSGSEFLCTKDHGDITLEPERGGVRVVCSR